MITKTIAVAIIKSVGAEKADQIANSILRGEPVWHYVFCSGCRGHMVACIPQFARRTYSQACSQAVWRAGKRRRPNLEACDACDEQFRSTRSDRRFCSDTCRQRVQRANAAAIG